MACVVATIRGPSEIVESTAPYVERAARISWRMGGGKRSVVRSDVSVAPSDAEWISGCRSSGIGFSEDRI
jgi:hypothetical protein